LVLFNLSTNAIASISRQRVGAVVDSTTRGTSVSYIHQSKPDFFLQLAVYDDLQEQLETARDQNSALKKPSFASGVNGAHVDDGMNYLI
jgi:hypothetical protein